MWSLKFLSLIYRESNCSSTGAIVLPTQLEQLWDWCLTLFPQEKLKKIELKTKMQQELKANQFDKNFLIKWIDKRGPQMVFFPIKEGGWMIS